MSLFEDIVDIFVELGSGIKDASVELGEDLLEIVNEDIPNDLAEIGNIVLDSTEKAGGKTIDKVDDMIETAIDAAATHVSAAVTTTVSNIFKKIK